MAAAGTGPTPRPLRPLIRWTETANGVKSGQTPAPSRLKAAQNAGHTSCDGSLCLWRQSDTIGFLRQFFRPELCVDSCPQPAANSAIPTPSSLIPSTMGCSPLMTNGGSHRSTGRLNGLRASNASRRLENTARLGKYLRNGFAFQTQKTGRPVVNKRLHSCKGNHAIGGFRMPRHIGGVGTFHDLG